MLYFIYHNDLTSSRGIPLDVPTWMLMNDTGLNDRVGFEWAGPRMFCTSLSFKQRHCRNCIFFSPVAVSQSWPRQVRPSWKRSLLMNGHWRLGLVLQRQFVFYGKLCLNLPFFYGICGEWHLLLLDIWSKLCKIQSVTIEAGVFHIVNYIFKDLFVTPDLWQMFGGMRRYVLEMCQAAQSRWDKQEAPKKKKKVMDFPNKAVQRLETQYKEDGRIKL